MGAIPTIAPYLLPKTLASFAKAHPEITVSVIEDLTQSLRGQLAAGDLDLAVLSLPVRGPEVVAQPLFNEKMLLAVSTRHRLWRLRRPAACGEVVDEPFLLLKDGHCFRDDVLKICKRSRLNPTLCSKAGSLTP